MKIFITSMFLTLGLFAGGDILPVDPISKYEKMDHNFNNDVESNYVEAKDPIKSFKPTVIDNCVTSCGEPATLLPYYGEDIPTAATELCLAEEPNANVN